MCRGGLHIASAYLHSSLGVKHKLNLDCLQAIAGVLTSLKGPWVLAADFQMHTGAIRSHGVVEASQGQGGGPEDGDLHGENH